MESLTNPYTPGAGAPPPALARRDDELDAFRLLIGRLEEGRHENSLILFGLRGVGKTVLLGEMEQIAEARDWQAISTRCAPARTSCRHSHAPSFR